MALFALHRTSPLLPTAAWYLTDYQGSVRNLTDASGTLQDTISYDAYGNATESNQTFGDQFKYAGGQVDSATGLEKFGARWYDPYRGDWTTQDPTGFGGGDPNLYRYVGNAPSNGTDPSGLWFLRRRFRRRWYPCPPCPCPPVVIVTPPNPIVPPQPDDSAPPFMPHIADMSIPIPTTTKDYIQLLLFAYRHKAHLVRIPGRWISFYGPGEGAGGGGSGSTIVPTPPILPPGTFEPTGPHYPGPELPPPNEPPPSHVNPPGDSGPTGLDVFQLTTTPFAPTQGPTNDFMRLLPRSFRQAPLIEGMELRLNVTLGQGVLGALEQAVKGQRIDLPAAAEDSQMTLTIILGSSRGGK
jgi:RHS repeat-associated protein